MSEPTTAKRLICNAAHLCPVKDCGHKIPHRSNFGDHCGPAMTCFSSGIVCGCTPIIDEQYKTYRRKACACCGGRGFEDVSQTHAVPLDEHFARTVRDEDVRAHALEHEERACLGVGTDTEADILPGEK